MNSLLIEEKPMEYCTIIHNRSIIIIIITVIIILVIAIIIDIVITTTIVIILIQRARPKYCTKDEWNSWT